MKYMIGIYIVVLLKNDIVYTQQKNCSEMRINMTKREKQLKKREQKFKWSQIGMFGENSCCPLCEGTNIIQLFNRCGSK